MARYLRTVLLRRIRELTDDSRTSAHQTRAHTPFVGPLSQHLTERHWQCRAIHVYSQMHGTGMYVQLTDWDKQTAYEPTYM